MSHKKIGYVYENDWPIEEMKSDTGGLESAIVLPVNVEIEAEHTVISPDKLKEYIANANQLTLMDCSCRMKRKHCDAPYEGVCLGLNGWADKYLNGKDFQYRHPFKATKEQALKVLEKTTEAGLVHMAYIYKDNQNPGGPDAICSCCSCCCELIGATLRYGMAPHVWKGTAKSTRDEEKCINCGKCAERCHFGARELVNGSLQFDSSKCFGCGLCASTCPANAITTYQLSD